MAIDPNWQAEPIERLGLSARTFNCLRFRGVKTVGQLCGFSELELLEHQSWGETALREIRARLTERGLQMREHRQPQPQRCT